MAKKAVEKKLTFELPLLGTRKPTPMPSHAKHAIWKRLGALKGIYEQVMTNVAGSVGEKPKWVPLGNLTATSADSKKVEIALVSPPAKKGGKKSKVSKKGVLKKRVWVPYRTRDTHQIVSKNIKEQVWVPVSGR